MKFSKPIFGNCDLCGKPKKGYDHNKCYRLRKAFYADKVPPKRRRKQPYSEASITYLKSRYDDDAIHPHDN